MHILRRRNAEFSLLQRVVHKMTIEFEMVNYLYILLVLTQVFIKALLFKNLFTHFPIAINDKIQQDLYFVRNL
jgi:hypothetical protein